MLLLSLSAFSQMAESEEVCEDTVSPVPRVEVARLLTELRCLFFGQRALVVPLQFRSAGDPGATSYRLERFYDSLSDELELVDSILGIERMDNKVECLPNNIHVHMYGSNTIACSSLKLSTASDFFKFELKVESLPQTTLDIRPFLYAKPHEDVPWDWDEAVWTRRLLKCIEHGSLGVTIIPAYLWKSNDYQSQIGKLFPRVRFIHAAPFHGMTDLLLFGNRSVAVINIVDDDIICSVEVGCIKGSMCPITISCVRKVWPEKVGELLASMYQFGTLNYLNNLKAMPKEISMIIYGILAIRLSGCLVVKMRLDSSGCCVQLLHDGPVTSLGEAIQQVVKHIKRVS